MEEVLRKLPNSWKDTFTLVQDGYVKEEEELKHYNKTPDNTFLIICLPDTDIGGQLSEKLCDQFKCVNTDVYRLCLQEARDRPEAPLGKEIKRRVLENRGITLEMQAELLGQALEHTEESGYRGYCFHNIPSFGSEAQELLTTSGLEKYPPKFIIDLLPLDANEMAAVKEGQDKRNLQNSTEEWQLREKEKQEDREKQELAEKKAEKKRKQEERIQRQQERERKLEEAAELGEEEEEAERARQEEEAKEDEVAEEDEGEEEEEEVVLDENGDAIPPEELKAKEDEKERQKEERRWNFDLRKCISKGIDVATTVTTLDTPSNVNLLKVLIETAKREGTYIQGNPQETADVLTKYVIKQVDLGPSPVCTYPFSDFTYPIGTEEEVNVDELDAEYSAKVDELLMTYTLSTHWMKYCPVTYHDHHVLVEGLVFYVCLYKDHIYHLASSEAARKFCKNPHTYLNKRFKQIPNMPILLMRRTNSTLTDNHLEDKAVIQALCDKLSYQEVSFEQYHKHWLDRKEEERRKREEEERKRREEEEKRRREEQLRLEQEARQKRARIKKGVKNRKKIDDDGAESPSTGSVSNLNSQVPSSQTSRRTSFKDKEEGQEGDGEEEDQPPPLIETPEQKLQKEIESKIAAKEVKPEVILNAFSFEEDAMKFLYDNRLLPETVVVLESIVPKDPDAEEEEEDEIEQDDNATAATPKLDKNNDKQYQRYIQALLEKFQSEEDDEPEEVIEEGGEEEADETEEPKQPTIRLPKQTFTIHNINCHALPQNILTSYVDYILQPFKQVASVAEPPAAEEEEVENNEDREDGENGEGWGIRPTPKPILGWSKHFCPVTLATQNSLRQGNRDFVLSYKYQTYMFKSEAEMNLFQTHPDRYTIDIPPPLPPPRLWIVGVHSSGKSIICNNLHGEFGIERLQYDRSVFNEITGLFVKVRGKDPHPERFVTAKAELRQLDHFDAEQERKKAEIEEREKQREEREKRIEAGEDVEEEEEDDDDEDDEWEPEDEESKRVRLLKAYSAVVADILKYEPYKSKGYMTDGYPISSETQDAFLSQDIWPEVVVYIKISDEHYIRRNVEQEFNKRREERLKKLAQLKKARARKEEREKKTQLKQWRKRNLDIEEEDADESDEDIEDDPDEVLKDDVESDLRDNYNEQLDPLSEMLDQLAEHNVKVVTIDGDRSQKAVYSAVKEQLNTMLDHRQSMLESPYVVRFDAAVQMLQKGYVSLSAFNFKDSVDLFMERTNTKDVYTTIQLKPPHPPPPPQEIEPEEPTPPPLTASEERLRKGRLMQIRLMEKRQALNERKQKEKEELAQQRKEARELRKARKAEQAAEEGEEEDELEEEEEEEELEEEDEMDYTEEMEMWMQDIDEEMEKVEIEQLLDERLANPVEGESDEAEFEAGEEWPWSQVQAPPPEEEEEDDEGDDDDEEELTEEQLEELKREQELEARKRKYASQRKTAIFRERVYFFDSDENMKQFQGDPWMYIKQAPPRPHVIPKVIIMNPHLYMESLQRKWEEGNPLPCSLGEQLSNLLGAVYLTSDNIIRDVINMENTYLSRELVNYRQLHGTNSRLIGPMLRKTVQYRMSMADVLSCGYVLNDMPSSPTEAQELSQIGFLPNKVIVLHTTEGPECEAAQTDVRRDVWEWYHNTYHNVIHITMENKNEWELVYSSMEHIRNMLQKVQLRKFLVPLGKPVPVYDTCITRSELSLQQCKYRAYCPYNWLHHRWFVDATEEDHHLKYTAMYKGKVYRFASSIGLDDFLNDPDMYLDDDNKHSLPDLVPRKLPIVLADSIQEDQYSFSAFCPVTLWKTQNNVGLQGKKQPTTIWGKNEFTVVYGDKYYRMCSKETRDEFLKQPWVYVNATLPDKIPLHQELLATLPVNEYMEHTIYESVVRALLAVEEFKPLFPYLNGAESALKFIALYMKAHNPHNNSIRALQYGANFHKFCESCKLFDYFLSEQEYDPASISDPSSEYAMKAKMWDSIQKGDFDISCLLGINNEQQNNPASP